MILRFVERGRVVTRDLLGEELYQTLRDRTNKDGHLTGEVTVFKGFPGIQRSTTDLFPWTLSTNTKDRMGDVVDQSWQLDFYKANPVILWAHNHSIPAIGVMESIEASEELKGLIRFAGDIDPFAKSIAQRAAAGILRAGSVGFIPMEITPIEETINGKTYITGYKLSKNELLEFSICNVPANPMALAEEPKSIEPETVPLPSTSGGLKMFTRREETK